MRGSRTTARPAAADKRLASDPIFDDIIGRAWVSADHRLASRTGVTVGDLRGETMQLLRGDRWGVWWHAVRERVFAAMGGPPATEENATWDEVWAKIAAGQGWCPMPHSLARAPLCGTVLIPITDFSVPMRFAATWRAGAETPVVKTVRRAKFRPCG